MPFGNENGVACFQCTINKFIEREGLLDTFTYLGNATICGKTQEKHGCNLEKFLKSAENINLTYNHNKCSFSQNKNLILGYLIDEGKLKPDPSRLQPIKEMPPPHNPLNKLPLY